MNTEQTATTSTAASSLGSSVQPVVTDADSRSITAVTTLGLVHQARLSSQNRAVNAAVSAYGKGSPQAAAAMQAVAVTQSASARLNLVQAKISTPQPTIPAQGWVIHGRVYDSASNPQKSFTVFLVDAQKNYIDQFGFSYTDSTGYFLISYDPSAAGAAAPAPPPEISEPAASTAPREIFLEVADASANPVFVSQTPLTPVVGQAIYQTVTLPAGATKLGDPPAEIRTVALPPAVPPAQSSTGKGTGNSKPGSNSTN